MKLVCVFHAKQKVVIGDDVYDPEVGSNPPLTMTGMESVVKLIPALEEQGPFDGVFCSNMSRALCTASVIALRLGLTFQTVLGLGQYGNLDGKNVIPYPEHELDDENTWQNEAMVAIQDIAEGFGLHRDGKTALVISHRPVIAALKAAAQGIYDKDGIAAIVNDPDLTKDGFVVFNYDKGQLTLAA